MSYKGIVKFVLFVLAVILLVWLASKNASASDRYPKERSQHQVIIMEVPVQYAFGMLEGSKVVEHNGHINTLIQIQPYGAGVIYNNRMTFCGNITGMLKNQGVLVVLTYYKSISQVGCYDILSIHSVIPNESEPDQP